MERGISFVVCTRNGAARLRPTLEHLAAQRFREPVAREVLLVDNASTDATGDAARRFLPCDPRLPLRIVHEPRPGTGFARGLGLREATYEYVTFVDDDNWLVPEFGQMAFDLMASDSTIGLLPARSEPVFAVPKPRWFDEWRSAYAVGEQFTVEGDVSRQFSQWWAAGLTVRTAAWKDLVENGFQPRLSGRDGRSLAGGEDTEICLALLLAGWRAHYDARLLFYHWMPAERLTLRYARRLIYQGPIPGASISAYRLLLRERHGIRGDPGLSPTSVTIARKMISAMLFAPRFGLWFLRNPRGDLAQLRLAASLGSLAASVHFGRCREELVARLRTATWLGRGPERVARRSRRAPESEKPAATHSGEARS